MELDLEKTPEAASLATPITAAKIPAGDSDVSSTDDQDEVLLRPVRKKRPNRRYTEWSSDEELSVRALKQLIRSHESRSGSDGESDSNRPQNNAGTRPELPAGVIRGCPKCSDCQTVIARWQPDAGSRVSLDEAPVFHPSEEEFRDTLSYIAKIRPDAEPYGICRVVPPPGWQPPCPLREDSAKLKQLKFPTRVQEIHKLQSRGPVRKNSPLKLTPGGKRKRAKQLGRMGRACQRGPNMFSSGCTTKTEQPDETFGFEPGSYFSIGMFEKYAHEFEDQYFSTSDASGTSINNSMPSIEAIEAEYWRIVEQPSERIEVLYGADVETGVFGSGFPKAMPGEIVEDSDSYKKSGWNLNNIARLPGSMLFFEEGDISGVLVPWLYIGMCFSSFCWHVEDHHFYSLNYMHWGAPKIWYGVPSKFSPNLEAAMKKRLPDLFEEQPDLLHKLVTQLSPNILKEEGLPVYRLIQRPGEFVITFPRAYHSGFNCGFNCAEAVNVAPVDWLPHGQSAVELYRQQRRKTSVSHDKLLLAAAKQAVKLLRQVADENDFKNMEANVKEDLAEQMENITKACSKVDIVYSWQTFCGKDGVLARALKARVEMEQLQQTSLMGDVHMKKMDYRFDATDERECADCHYDLHLSAIGCECCPEKYVCLQHSSVLCQCPWGKKSVLYRYDLNQLDVLVRVLEEQPGALNRWLQLEQYMELVTPETKFSGYWHAAKSRLKLQDTVSKVVQVELPGLDTPFQSTPLQSFHSSSNTHEQFLSRHDIGDALTGCKLDGQLSGCFTSSLQSTTLKTEESRPCVGRLRKKFLGTATGELLKVRRQNTEALVSTNLEVIILSDDEEDGNKTHGVSGAAQMAQMPTEHVTNTNEVITELVKCTAEKEKSSLTCAIEFAATGLPDKLETGSIVPPVPSLGTVPHELQGASGLGSDAISESTVYGSPLLPLKPVENKSMLSNIATNDQLTRGITTFNSLSDISLSDGESHVKKNISYEVELLKVGTLVLRNGWHNKQCIFPAGFKSRTQFFLNLQQKCTYTSEIIECGPQSAPLFKVTLEGHNSEAFISDSVDMCWQKVLDQLNQEIIRLGKLGLGNPPPLQPQGTSHGLEMFGLTTPSIVQAMESLDKHRECVEYWATKRNVVIDIETRPTTPAKLATDVSTARPHLHKVLKGFFQKGSDDELWAFHRLFSCEWQGQDWRDGFQALTEVLSQRTQ